MSDASRKLYDSSTSGEPVEGEPEPPSKRNSALDKWIETVDTRKMTLAEYKKFLQLQQEQGD